MKNVDFCNQMNGTYPRTQHENFGIYIDYRYVITGKTKGRYG